MPALYDIRNENSRSVREQLTFISNLKASANLFLVTRVIHCHCRAFGKFVSAKGK